MKKVVSWIDQRFPLTHFVKHSLTEYPTPKNLNYWWNFGSIAGLVLMIQLVTGIFLAMHYKADVLLAFDSVEHIMRDVNYGWLIRFMHSTGASAFFAVIFLHMARTLYYGSYRRPRELMWWTGQGLLILLMATAFMGYLLPWGQMSYWGAQVITSLFGTVPFMGDELVTWLRGDFVVGDATLTRFFSMHYLLPFVITGAVVIHVVALHHVRSSNPTGVDLPAKDNIPLHPYFTIKDLFGYGVFFIIFSWFVFYNPNMFIEPDNYIPANPLQTPVHIVPEWYFLPFYAILRAVPDLLGGVIAMAISVGIFAAMPYLDRSRIPGGARYRPIYRIMFYVFVLDVLVLGYVGAKPPEGVLIPVGQVATFIYFAVFVLLPFGAKHEERWVRSRGLPAAVEEMIKKEEAEIAARDAKKRGKK
ncbi:MAG: cytochrome b/b6 [Gammaproteobacteria bacterium]|nr:cytochrome b/b6 [Gammaproteobacteria bacterium]